MVNQSMDQSSLYTKIAGGRLQLPGLGGNQINRVKKGEKNEQSSQGKNYSNRCTELHTDIEQRSPKTCLMLGLSFTGRIHLSDMASKSFIAFECSSPPAISLSIQSIPRPS